MKKKTAGLNNGRAARPKITEANVKRIAELEKETHVHQSWGEWLADELAAIVGSWSFLIVQSCLLGSWICLNTMIVVFQWDPYPFTLLNLVLSFQAAFATPVILMSQNRQALLNERRNHLDLQINLLAEQENTKQLQLLRLLCEKAGIELDGDEEQLEEETKPEELVEEIKKHVENDKNPKKAHIRGHRR